jgi:hypothetical protein
MAYAEMINPKPVLSGRFYRQIMSTNHVKDKNDCVVFNSQRECFDCEKTTGMTSVIIEFNNIKTTAIVEVQRCYYEEIEDLKDIFEQYMTFYEEEFGKSFAGKIQINPDVIHYRKVMFRKLKEKISFKTSIENFSLQGGYRFYINSLIWEISKPDPILMPRPKIKSFITNDKENCNPNKRVKLDNPLKSSSLTTSTKQSSSQTVTKFFSNEAVDDVKADDDAVDDDDDAVDDDKADDDAGDDDDDAGDDDDDADDDDVEDDDDAVDDDKADDDDDDDNDDANPNDDDDDIAVTKKKKKKKKPKLMKAQTQLVTDFQRLHDLEKRYHRKFKEVSISIFNSIFGDNGLENVTLNEAKARALASYKESVVKNLHPIFRLLVLSPRQNKSRLGSLMQLMMGGAPNDDTNLEGVILEPDEEEEETRKIRRTLTRKWNEIKNKYAHESPTDEEKVLNFLNEDLPVERTFSVEHLKILGANNTSVASNTSIVPLMLAFVNSGKY